MDLEVARADRHLDAVSVPAGAANDFATLDSPIPKKRRSAARAPAPRLQRADRLRLERPRPQPAQLPRRAREDDDDACVRSAARSPAPCRRARARRLRGKRRLLAHARLELDVIASAPRGERAGDGLDLGLQLGPHLERHARHLRDHLDVRSSCVGPSPPDTRHSGAWIASPSTARNSSGRSPTTTMRLGSNPSRAASCARNPPFASRRSPRTSSLPVATTTARSATTPSAGRAGRRAAWPSRRSRRAGSRRRSRSRRDWTAPRR